MMSLTGKRRSARGWVCFAVACIALVHSGTAASGQYNTGFEPPEILGTAFGTDLNGQAGFFNPVPATSVSARVFSYAGNSLGIPLNPGGGAQFAAGVGPGGGFFARSQRDTAFGNGTGRWTIAADIAIAFHGVLPAAQNIGSITTRIFGSPGTANLFILARWTNTSTANSWNADYIWFDFAGNGILESIPHAGFQNLLVNRWYRWATTFDLSSNRITEVSMSDLAAGTVATFLPTGRYLIGGSAGSPTPTGFRLFAGAANTPGNTVAIDNIRIFERILLGDCDGNGVLEVAADLPCFVNALLGIDTMPPGGIARSDLNGDGVANGLDVALFVGCAVIGCP